MLIANVIVDVPTLQTNRPWAYGIPKQLQDVVTPGMRVQAPFGNGSRLLQGFVVSVETDNFTEFSDKKLKLIQGVLDLEPVLNPELIQLGQVMAKQNFAFQISMFQTMLPNFFRARYEKSLVLMEPSKVMDERVQQLFADRDEVAFNREEIPDELLSVLKRYQQQKIIKIHYHIKNQAKSKLVRQFKAQLTAENYLRLRSELKLSATKQARMLTYLSEHSNDEWRLVSALEKEFNFSSQDVKKAEEKGWLQTEYVEAYRQPETMNLSGYAQPLTLNFEQVEAYQTIQQALIEQKKRTFLLEGVTGSGKTEVYLHSIAQALELGKSAIMLVPEITLTPQMVQRVKGRFGAQVAVLHSGLSDGERYDEWRRINQGTARVVVGARSAIFAPVENLGLIIIDEEHENSYKQDDNPRYHAREVADWRADFHQATVVLGSATPSLESRARAQKGIYTLLHLQQRVKNNSLPHAEIIDMTESLKVNGDDLYSKKLIEAIKARLVRHEQTVLMLNRRGYANFMMCRDCGYVPMCPNCDLAMTVHADTHRLECHVCGATQSLPYVCPQCHSKRIRPFGTGTQKAEMQLQKLLPQAKILRMDNDTTRRKGSVEKLLTSFGRQEADILIGTQMIAKGLDFPNVTLVGVLNADTSLRLPDFRASERTFQLITQVAGRAGRADKAGEVLIQTFNPQHYAIQLAKDQDYERFYQQEMRLRHQWRYAPYYYSIQIKFVHADEMQAVQAAMQTAEWLKNHVADNTMIFGPAPSGVKRLKNKYHYQVLIRYQHDAQLEQAMTQLMDDAQKWQAKGVQISIDRDPLNIG